MFSNLRVRVALGRTINLGNFESLRVDVEFAADVENHEDVDKLFDQVKNELDERIEELVPKPSKPTRGKIISEEYVP